MAGPIPWQDCRPLPVDILEGILMLLKQIGGRRYSPEIQYKRVVKPEGNRKAVEVLYSVFEPEDTVWRGLGPIGCSGLKLNNAYKGFDARNKLGLKEVDAQEDPRCRCGEVLKGLIDPLQCSLFGKGCTPVVALRHVSTFSWRQTVSPFPIMALV